MVASCGGRECRGVEGGFLKYQDVFLLRDEAALLLVFIDICVFRSYM